MTLNGVDTGELLEVTRGGLATYSKGVSGQFVLYHTRADPRYPGAFFLPHSSIAGQGADWEYAWLEDLADGLQLTVRRFCGKGPVACTPSSSPEGSPNYWQTLIGTPFSKAASPCSALDPNAQTVSAALKGTCCRAVEAVKGQ